MSNKIVQDIRTSIDQVSVILVNEVIEEVEGLQSLRRETLEHHKDGVDEEISIEWDRLQFHNVKLDIPVTPNEDLAAVAGALAKELWKVRVNDLLDQYASQEPEYPVNFRL